MTDEQKLLIGLARVYMKLVDRFGTPGQDTFMRFPSIQGFAFRACVERLAAIPGALSIVDPAGLADRVCAAAGLADQNPEAPGDSDEKPL